MLAAIPFGLYWGIYFGWEKDFWSAAWSGITAGVIAGLVVAAVRRYQENRVRESDPVLIDEVLLREAPATHDGMAGRLYLSDRRVFFEGYLTDEIAPEVTGLFEGRAEEPVHHFSIPILSISDVVVARKLGLDIRVDIRLADGQVKSFATEDTLNWADDISTARQKYLDEPRSEEMKLFP